MKTILTDFSVSRVAKTVNVSAQIVADTAAENGVAPTVHLGHLNLNVQIGDAKDEKALTVSILDAVAKAVKALA